MRQCPKERNDVCARQSFYIEHQHHGYTPHRFSTFANLQPFLYPGDCVTVHNGFWSQCLNRCSLGLLPNDSDFWSLEISVALWSSRLVLSKTTPMGEGPRDCGTSCGHFFPILTAIAVRVDLNGLRNYSVTQVSSKASLNAPLRQPFQIKQVACPG